MGTINSPLVIVPSLSAVAIKYRQKGFIADKVLPRVKVDAQEFIATSDRMEDWITPPDTTVGRTSQPNQLANSISDPTYLATVNQGLDEPVPNQDEMNGPQESALQRAVQRVMGFVELRRELRAATLLTTLANYGYSATLAGSNQFSDTTSKPVKVLLDYLDLPFMRPNKIVMGRSVWTTLSQHPNVLESVFWTGAQAGKVSRQQLAELLEVDEIIVGDGWINSAVKGAAVSKGRVWGKFIAGIYIGEGEGENGNMWGYTAQFGNRVAGTIQNPNIGLFGGVNVRAGESVKEVVAAPEFGFCLAGAIA
jgi:hypothetical protein